MGDSPAEAEKVKVTLYIDSSIVKEGKKLAIDKATSLSAITEEALRTHLQNTQG